MRIAISATGPGLDDEVDPRFGRCGHFVIVDPETMEIEHVENTNVMASGGAGIATAQMVANKGVQAVLTGNCGPNAFQTLAAAGIEVITGVAGKIRDAIEGYKGGRFQVTSQPTVEAHFGMSGTGMDVGVGPGMGMGRGMGMAAAPASPQQELDTLKAQSQTLAQQVSDIQRRIEELEAKGQ
jgi:predicted Fe-Mo cluster-binding NifX family protein